MLILYPKIETLYDRDGKFRVDPNQLRLPEFAIPKRWLITEKIDGMAVRIHWLRDWPVRLLGRTDDAQMPPALLGYLNTIFAYDGMVRAFPNADEAVILFGEGYGPKIQNGGNYRPNVGFRLFDVLVGPWWLEPDSVADVAQKFGIRTAPVLGEIAELPRSASDLRTIVFDSVVASEDGGTGRHVEGIVARTVPLLLTRRGDRLMWKLKFKDFDKE